ncbi:PD-(D/E)XK nuclease family protein [Blattabacterium cuenoti]|uniref:PD-(D/E)XK nuclease family protein n=1 Tax=Blattabacterium cuenoti TaxID=1653831 RepID=UPI00163BDC59|nr:PD-(D/E)XK nuclease family protein [Blattabacterium cuenoti]
MKQEIIEIIEDLLRKKYLLNHQLIFLSKDPSIIEFIQKEYGSYFKQNQNQFLTIKKFSEKITGLKQIDNYCVFTHFLSFIRKNDFLEKKFVQFIKWIPIIINDFQIIDGNLLNHKYFFKLLISEEKITKWNTSSIEEKRFIFWEKIYHYYNLLQSHLLKKGYAYKEMLFQQCINHLNAFFKKSLNVKILFFFTKHSIINRLEEKIVQKIREIPQCILYELNKNSITNHFRKNESISYSEKIKNLEIISVSNEIEQIKVIEEIISHQYILPRKILIIPCNHSMIIPLIYSVKKKLKINISSNIKYPLKHVPIHKTFQAIFQFFLLKKHKRGIMNRNDIEKIITNGYILKFFSKKNSFIKKFYDLNDSEIISIDFIKQCSFPYDLQMILQTDIHDIKNVLKGILSFIRKSSNLLLDNVKKHKIELQFLLKLECLIFRLKIFIRKKIIPLFSIEDLFHIYEQFVKIEQINYRKKNYLGLSIKNFTENFLEKFDLTIITSFNEGVIPTKNYSYIHESFIPIELQKRFEMNMYKNNYYFHHFIRIFYASKKTYILFKDQTDEISRGEIHSLIHRLKINLQTLIKKKTFSIQKKKIKYTLTIKKQSTIIQRFNELKIKGLSPTSIKLYNQNPILFYCKKILNIKEKKSFNMQIGAIIHDIIKILYKPIQGCPITIEKIKNMKNRINPTIKKYFLEKKKIIEGKNVLYYSIIKNYLYNFISWDENHIKKGHQVILKKIEYNMSTLLHLKNEKVKIHGIIDRIDEIDGMTRILDYKIGFSKKKKIQISINQYKEIFINPNYANVMQLMIYIYLWFKSKRKRVSASISIISPIKSDKLFLIPIFFLKKNKNMITYEEYKKKILPFLIERILSIFDLKQPMIENLNDY